MPFFKSCFKKNTPPLIKSAAADELSSDPLTLDSTKLGCKDSTNSCKDSTTVGSSSKTKTRKLKGAKHAQQRSLRPKKAHRSVKHRTLHTMKKTATRTLTLEAAARIPAGEDPNDWHAVNLLDFYNDLSLLMGILEELCTKSSCPHMSAGPNFKYLWADKGSKPMCVCAATYIDKMMVWVECQLDDAALFPIDSESEYPKDFHKRLHNIFKKMFRAYAHAYHSHFDAFVSLGAESHLNTCFKHFVIYGQTHQFLRTEDQAPLKDFIPTLLQGGGKGVLQNSLA